MGDRAASAFSELVPAPERGRVFERRIMPGLSDASASGRVRLDALARWLQDVAYLDLVDAGLGGRGAWVVRRARIRVDRFPVFGEEASLRTFCSGASPLVAERRTSISAGAARIEAVALWVHLDPTTMRPTRLDDEFLAVYGESSLGRRARARLQHPEPPSDAQSTPWRFRAADVDVAGHVNNAAYWEPIEELLLERPDPEVADLEIEFREGAQPGEANVLRGDGAVWVTSHEGTVHASIVGLAGLV